MKHFNTSRTMLWLMVLLSSLSTYAQNSMVGDGFGGRAGYQPVNYNVGNTNGYAVCGSNRQLSAWGIENQKYSFGTGSPSPQTSWTPVVAASSLSNLLQVSAAYPGGSAGSGAAIKDDGTGWVWGSSSSGVGWPTPTQIVTDAYFVSAGDYVTSFVKKDGTIVSVGSNVYGHYGNGTIGGTQCYAGNCSPIPMTGITNAKRIAVGTYYSLILLADGTVKQVGDVSSIGFISSYNSKTPVVVPGLSNIVDVRTFQDIFYVLTASGQVYTWNTTNPTTPTLVTFPAGAAPIKAIIAQSFSQVIMAIDDNGKLYGWGRNGSYQLGIGDRIDQTTPQLITTNVRDAKISTTFTYIFKTDGTMWVTGKSATYQTGLSSTATSHPYPEQITPPCAFMDFNGMPPCVAGTTAPAVTPTTATNSCPTTTVNLGSLAVSSTTPSGAKLIWSTHKVPTSAADTLTTAQKAAVSTAGTYYALYYDATNACYSPADSVVVTMTTCAPITVTNTCPTATVNLMTAISATNMPSGATVTWHTGTPATAANKVVTPTAVSTSGTYYMAYYDGNADCYSDASPPLTVTITPCVTPLTVNNAPAQTATTGSAKTGNAATELAPTGGTSPYIYSNGAGDAACVAPSGATALTGLTVNSDGTYSYTAPTTAGTYYYCIKVCDSTTPTAQCVVKTYTLTVTAAASCTISNIMPTFIKN